MDNNINRNNIASFLLFVLLLSPAVLVAGNGNDVAVSLLDKAVKVMRDDAGVRMDFTYAVSDADGEVLFSDNGYFCLGRSADVQAAERYTLQMQQVRIWCNGERQWNFMEQTNEIYITAADSEEAQGLSPLHLMQLYKSGEYECSVEAVAADNVVTLASKAGTSEFSRIKVWLSAGNSRLVKLQMFTSDGNVAEIVIDAYKPHCSFDSSLFECPLSEYPDAEVVDMF